VNPEIGVFYGVFRVGVIFADSPGPRFRYDPRWLATSNAFPVSLRMPLSAAEIGPEALLPWLANLLPEDGTLLQVGRNLGVAPQDVLGLILRIGRDTAGALSIGAPEGADGQAGYRIVPTEADLERIIDELPAKPFLAGEEGVAMSLAGGQDKLPVAIVEDRVAIPVYGAPSTHILKPDNPRLWGSVFNEAFCLDLARRLGLSAASAITGRAGARAYLLVARFDRAVHANRWLRLHQEDFCQALGRPPAAKYERNQSGLPGPGLVDMIALARRHLTSDSLLALGDAAVFNILIDNVDSHAKNYAILWRGPRPRLAPLYDLMCGGVWPNLTCNPPQTIGGQARGDHIMRRHWQRFASAAQLGPAQLIRRVRELGNATLTAIPAAVAAVRAMPAGDHPILDLVAGEVAGRCRRVLAHLDRGGPEEDPRLLGPRQG
jgi:serine/threonine-protein kinase HipA